MFSPFKYNPAIIIIPILALFVWQVRTSQFRCFVYCCIVALFVHIQNGGSSFYLQDIIETTVKDLKEKWFYNCYNSI